jgi:HD-like signal output (HDOD) protein/anti-anti-sigma regulatory factor/DNA-binding response OmpR family regulator
MKTIALLISNEKEKTVLEHYFASINYKVVLLKSNFTTFRQLLDEHPICIICEMPQRFLDNLYVIKMLGNQKKTENIPVIAYGNHTDMSVIRSMYESGVELYYQRPLQIKLILDDIEDLKKGASIKIKRYRTTSENPPVSAPATRKSQHPTTQAQKPSPVTTTSATPTENNLTVAADELEAVEHLMDPVTSPQERVEIIIGRVKEMLAFPFTIVKILEITQNDQTGATDLAKAIEADPVIVSSLLSISNTVYYARQGKRINDVQEAIVRLGFVETKNIALSLSVMSMFASGAKSEGFNRFEFWYHSLACGILAEQFARKAHYPSPEKAFICGLLHDFGIILLDEFFNGFFTSVYEQVAKNKSSFIFEEKRLWGMSHNSAVTQLFKGWNLPSDITATMGQLDQFGSMQSMNPENKDLLLVNIIGLSNLLAKALQLGKDCDDIIYPVSKKILQNINCATGIGDDLITNCMEKLNVYTEFFNLEKRNFKYPPQIDSTTRSISVIEHTSEMFFPHKYFLITNGYRIDEPQSSDNKESILEKRPDAILNLINSSIPEKFLEPFTNLPRKSHGSEQEPFIPAIFISLDKNTDLNFKSLSNAYCMPASVNMNILSTIVENMISNEELKSYEELAGQNSTPEQPDRVLSVNYLNDKTVLIALSGIIRLNSFNEIRSCLAKMLEQKIPSIGLQVNDIIDIDNLMTNLLVNFQKKAAEIGLNLCFCCIGKDAPEIIQNSNSLKSIKFFHREHELVSFLSRTSERTSVAES